MAAGWGQMAAVKILLEAGADVYAQDKRDKTAIFHAVEESRPKVLKLLLDRRGKENLGNEIDRFQNTPLHLASQLGYLSCVKVLLEVRISSYKLYLSLETKEFKQLFKILDQLFFNCYLSSK